MCSLELPSSPSTAPPPKSCFANCVLLSRPTLLSVGILSSSPACAYCAVEAPDSDAAADEAAKRNLVRVLVIGALDFAPPLVLCAAESRLGDEEEALEALSDDNREVVDDDDSEEARESDAGDEPAPAVEADEGNADFRRVWCTCGDWRC